MLFWFVFIFLICLTGATILAIYYSDDDKYYNDTIGENEEMVEEKTD